MSDHIKRLESNLETFKKDREKIRLLVGTTRGMDEVIQALERLIGDLEARNVEGS